MPYEIPLPCLMSLYNFPKLSENWTADTLEDYSDLHMIGFNIFKLTNNKAELSVNFPGIFDRQRETCMRINMIFKLLSKYYQGLSEYSNSINIGANQWPCQQEIYWLPSETNFATEHVCKNSFCEYRTNRKPNLTIHEESCSSETSVIAKEKLHY